MNIKTVHSLNCKLTNRKVNQRQTKASNTDSCCKSRSNTRQINTFMFLDLASVYLPFSFFNSLDPFSVWAASLLRPTRIPTILLFPPSEPYQLFNSVLASAPVCLLCALFSCECMPQKAWHGVSKDDRGYL